ncbi:TMEM175 family protein [Micromonospora sp. BRA006-A]|nr:TMEM175 family protein [Micromonospora sp. BRA006-A]
MLRALRDQWPVYLAYVTSYLYVAVNWLNHKGTFHRVRCADRGLHWANLGVLFSVALLPFVTGLVSRAVEEGDVADERVAVFAYALVGVILSMTWLWLYHYLSRHRGCWNRTSPPGSSRPNASGRCSACSRTRSPVWWACW